MVNTEKVRLMTKAAIFEGKEKNGAIRIVSFRRKDYIRYHMLFIMLSVTLAYAILVGAGFFMIVMAYDTLVLNISELILTLVILLIVYTLLLIFYYVVSHKYYGEKHIRARMEIGNYLLILKALREISENERQGLS